VSEESEQEVNARNMSVQLSTPTQTRSATMHSVTDRQTGTQTLITIMY